MPTLDVPGYAEAVCDWLDNATLPPIVLIGHSVSHGTCAIGLATIEEWDTVLRHARRRGAYRKWLPELRVGNPTQVTT